MGIGSPRASGSRAAYAAAAAAHAPEARARPEHERAASIDETSANIVRLTRALAVCVAGWIVLAAVAYAVYVLVA
jgi:hypothetical protein